MQTGNNAYVWTDEDRAIHERITVKPNWWHEHKDWYLMNRLVAESMGAVEVLVCDECGSDNVTADVGIVEWNAREQRFDLIDTLDLKRSVTCNEEDCILQGCEQSGDWVWRLLPPPEHLFGCSECGCTDIEHESWVETNTGKVTDDCGSLSVWCPQCENADNRSVEVDRLKPYKAPGEEAA